MKRKKQKLNLDIPVLDTTGKKVETLALNEKVFDGEVNTHVLYEVTRMYNANRRAGTASCKRRGDVSGGGKKPWRQKGTGRARTGSIRNPLWRGGGVIFGPHPRDFSYSVPQKVKKNALISGLNSKLADNNLLIIEELKIDQPKTKAFRKLLVSLGVKESDSAIMILDKTDRNIKLASRNIPKLIVTTGRNFSTNDILTHKKVIIQKSVMKELMKGLSHD